MSHHLMLLARRALLIGLVLSIAFGSAAATSARERERGDRDHSRVEQQRASRNSPSRTSPSRTSPSRTRPSAPSRNTPSVPTRPRRTPTAPPPSTNPAPAPNTGCRDADEMAMLSLINNYRAQNGLGPVSLSPTLTAAAEYHSVDMANKNYFSHTLQNGTSWSTNISNFGYYGGTRAENIAAGFPDAQRIFDMWKNSPGHRANMLNPNLKAIGIGRAYNQSSQYDWYWTTTFGGSVDSVSSC